MSESINIFKEAEVETVVASVTIADHFDVDFKITKYNGELYIDAELTENIAIDFLEDLGYTITKEN
jgi:hypothetical protein